MEITDVVPATKKALERVHVKNYCNGLELLCATRAPTNLDTAPTYCTPSSFQDVMLGVGAATRLVDEVIDRAKETKEKAPSAFGLIRPPGHHAVPRGAMGFCLVGTAAAAASEAAGGSGTKRASAKDRAVPIVGKRRRVLAPRN